MLWDMDLLYFWLSKVSLFSLTLVAVLRVGQLVIVGGKYPKDNGAPQTEVVGPDSSLSLKLAFSDISR